MAQLSNLRRATKTGAGPEPSASAGPAGATQPVWKGRQVTTLRTNFFNRAPRCSTGEVPNAHRSRCFAICRGTTHTVRVLSRTLPIRSIFGVAARGTCCPPVSNGSTSRAHPSRHHSSPGYAPRLLAVDHGGHGVAEGQLLACRSFFYLQQCKTL